ncbi:MAG: FAD-binding protein [Rhodobacteraceae bacterium]|nr:FAD-binding protein [Paracoccaceae bacterium]
MNDQTLPRPAADQLEAALGVLRQRFGERFTTNPGVREQHGHTTTHIPNQPPDAVVFPRSTEEVAEIVRTAAQYKVPIVPFGVGTSLEGHVNAAAGGVSIDFAQMNAVKSVHPEDLDVVVEPGITRTQLNTHLRDQGLFFPIDPGADATLGGMAATRASGTNAVRYGTMKDNILALEAVMADGRIIRTGTRARKSSAGYDLTRLLVGSEGTLGVITELTLRLHGIPEAMASARCTFPTVSAACDAVIATIQFGIPVARIELLDALQVKMVNKYSGLTLPEQPLLLLEFHGSEDSVAEQAKSFGEIADDAGAQDFEWTGRAEDRTKLWQARHDTYWANMQYMPNMASLVTDVCVPISRLADAVNAAQDKARELDVLAPVIGHVGDGNFHLTILIPKGDEAAFERAKSFVGWLNEMAISMEGTCTGEHGIGQGKRKYLPQELGDAPEVMRAIKMALDPDNLLNPGKIF